MLGKINEQFTRAFTSGGEKRRKLVDTSGASYSIQPVAGSMIEASAVNALRTPNVIKCLCGQRGRKHDGSASKWQGTR